MVVVTQSESAVTGRCQYTLVYSIDSSRLGIVTHFFMALRSQQYILRLHTDSAELSCTLCTATAYVLSCSTAQYLLKSLHWLLVSQRISFKLATLAYKIQSTSNLNTSVSSFPISILTFWFICVITLIYMSSISGSTYSNRIRQLCFHFSCTSL